MSKKLGARKVKQLMRLRQKFLKPDDPSHWQLISTEAAKVWSKALHAELAKKPGMLGQLTKALREAKGE